MVPNHFSRAAPGPYDPHFYSSPFSLFAFLPLFLLLPSGHLFTTVFADAAARWHRMRAEQDSSTSSTSTPSESDSDGSSGSAKPSTAARVVLMSGTDEHGNKVRDCAVGGSLSPLHHCDALSYSFQRGEEQAEMRGGMGGGGLEGAAAICLFSCRSLHTTYFSLSFLALMPRLLTQNSLSWECSRTTGCARPSPGTKRQVQAANLSFF